MDAVLADEITSTAVRLDCAVVCEIKNKKETSKILRQLAVAYPLHKRWSHLKRVKLSTDSDVLWTPGSSIVIITQLEDAPTDITTDSVHLHCLTGSSQLRPPCSDDLFAVPSCNGVEVDVDSLSAPCLCWVPRDPPLTRHQFVLAAKLWPTAFHEDKRVAQLITGNMFTTEEMNTAKHFMRLAVNQATRADANLKHSISSLNLRIGCIIVDPVSGMVLAESHDQRSCHPLHHAAMLCIDRIAEIQRSSTSLDKTDPYLCTGYDVYITREPCIMCAMALLHSRVRQVIYIHSDKDGGALGSRYKLHVHKSLNHHFEVYRGLLAVDVTTSDLYAGPLPT